MVSEALLKEACSHAQDYLQEQLDVLKQYCSIDCGTGNIAGNEKAAAITEELLKSIGAEVEHVFAEGTGTHVLGRIRPEGSTGKIIVSGHLDTVFEEGEAARHPFRIDGEMAYGLGIADCKGSVIVSVYAVKLLQACGLMPKKEIRFIFNADEETGAPSSKHLFYSESKDADAVLGLEPARGNSGVITFRPGYVTADIKLTGKEAHSFNAYKEGLSASLGLAELVTMLYGKNDEERKIFYNVTGLSTPKSLAKVSGEGEMSVSASVYSKEAREVIRKDITEDLVDAAKAKGYGIEAAYNDTAAVIMEKTERTLALYEKIRKAGSMIGQEIEETIANAPSDLNYYSDAGAPAVDGLGPYMYEIHTTNEHLKISSIPEKTALFAAILATV